MKRPSDRRYERYRLDASMWAQNPTQQDLASLLGVTKDQLEAIVRDKERYTSRRVLEISGKTRNLAVPTGPLRRVHERIKFQLNKVKQPDYLCSPRKGVGQRDNAERHVGGVQLLKIDIRQFYPRTMQEDIWRWAHYTMGIRDDVAGLIAKLVAIDGRMPFGSPVSPVLTTLVHRPMFDQIEDLCRSRSLTMSLWVDDLTVSGVEIDGDVITELRQIIRKGGFETHRIEHLSTARPINITGVPIAAGRVLAPPSLHRRIRDDFAALRLATSDNERSAIIDRLLSALGTYRYHLGASTKEGRAAADRMHALKQRRARMSITAVTAASSKPVGNISNTATLPWD